MYTEKREEKRAREKDNRRQWEEWWSERLILNVQRDVVNVNFSWILPSSSAGNDKEKQNIEILETQKYK